LLFLFEKERSSYKDDFHFSYSKSTERIYNLSISLKKKLWFNEEERNGKFHKISRKITAKFNIILQAPPLYVSAQCRRDRWGLQTRCNLSFKG
jgi:hypothetical protein